MSIPRRGSILANSSVLIVAYVISRLVGFISIVYMARVLGSGNFGQVNFAQAILVYASLLTHFGLMAVGTREVAQAPDRVRYVTNNILALRLLLAIAAYLLLAGASYAMPITSQGRLLVLMFGLTLFPSAATLDWTFKGLERMGVVAVIEVLRTVPFLLLLLLLVRGPHYLGWIGILYFAGMALAAAFSLLMYHRSYGPLRLAADLRYWKSSLRTAWPLGIAFVMVQVYYLTDTILLAFLKGDTAVGWYSGSYKIVAFIQGIGGWYFEATYPVVARLFKNSVSRLRELIAGSAEMTIALVLPVAAGGTLLAGPMIIAFYGREYVASAIAFQILVWAIAVELIGMLFGYSLMACDRLRQYLAAVTIGAVTSVVLNLLLIPRFGLAGAGSARLVSETLIAIYFFVQFRKVVIVPIARYFSKPVVATLVMVLALSAVHAHWVVRMLLGVLVYFGVFVLLSLRQGTPWYAPLRRIASGSAEVAEAIEHIDGHDRVAPTLEREAF
jgi:O-antigen/teichoic acid export membrane protein